MFRRLFFAFILIASSGVYAQNKELINSGDLLDKGSKLHDDGKYKEAIVLYKQISRSDTNYSRALYELSLSSYSDSAFKESKAYAEKGLELFPSKANEWYNLIANAEDDLGDHDAALKDYDKIIKLNQYDYTAWFNKGVTLYNLKRLSEAKQCFQKTIVIYPYYTSAHYFLGLICEEEGKFIPALLSYSTCLMINPGNRYLTKTVDRLSAIAAAKDDVVHKAEAAKSSDEDNFELQQEILLSKIALDKKYKLQTDLEDPITRQFQVVLEKLEYNAADKGFWMQYYVPFFNTILSGKQFDVFAYYMFSGLNIKSIQTYNKKNKKDVDAFINKIVAYLDEIKNTEVQDANARKNVKEKYLFSNKAVSGKGDWKGEGVNAVLIGPWEFYNTDGALKSKGLFNDNGDREGEWVFYNNEGQMIEHSFYKEGKLNGKSMNWFDNGNMYLDESYVNDSLEGVRKQYYYNGEMRYDENYINGKKNGIVKCYNNTGELYYIANYKDDKLEGELKYFHANGKTSSASNYQNGEANGSFKKYNEAGILIMEGNYEKGKETGTWKEYHPSGKILKEYAYVNGNAEGDYKEYYENGQLEETFVYRKGEIDGKVSYFDEDGKLYSESTYEKGRIREVKFYDKTGKVISNATTRNGAGNLTFYDPLGNKTSEGFFTKEGNRDGKTTYFYKTGKQSSLMYYRAGSLEGEKIIYYVNGNVSEKMNYVNDKIDGYYTSFHENNQLKSEGWLKEGDKQGEHIEYNALGNILSRKYYLNDDQDGYTQYYNANGKLDYEQLFSNGWIKKFYQYDTTGKVIGSYDIIKGNADFTFKNYNGKDYIKGSYRNYYLDGKYSVYFFDGSLSSEQYYNHGYNDSIYKQYYYGGQLRSEGKYDHGTKIGTWKYYYSNGQLYYAEDYINGEQNGLQVLYNEDGTKMREMTYKEDEFEGPYKMYGENNILAVQLNYHKGELISYTYEGKDGKLVEPVLLHNGTGLVTAYYKNGNKSTEINYVESRIDGIRKLYFSNGKVYVDGMRLLDNDNGPKKVYNVNGRLLEDENYLLDNLHGVIKRYYANGKLRAEENWYNGELNGICKYYDETGKLKQTRSYYYGILQSAW